MGCIRVNHDIKILVPLCPGTSTGESYSTYTDAQNIF
jgi:hypothetical protein